MGGDPVALGLVCSLNRPGSNITGIYFFTQGLERVRVPDDLCACPGFASTAVYFERLAQKETRDEDRRCRLLEVARFYRSLAQIIPGLPNGYKNNNNAKPSLTRAQRWRGRAEECRTLADCFTDPTCRGQLRQLAQDYDRMAEAAE